MIHIHVAEETIQMIDASLVEFSPDYFRVSFVQSSLRNIGSKLTDAFRVTGRFSARWLPIRKRRDDGGD